MKLKLAPVMSLDTRWLLLTYVQKMQLGSFYSKCFEENLVPQGKVFTKHQKALWSYKNAALYFPFSQVSQKLGAVLFINTHEWQLE